VIESDSLPWPSILLGDFGDESHAKKWVQAVAAGETSFSLVPSLLKCIFCLMGFWVSTQKPDTAQVSTVAKDGDERRVYTPQVCKD